MIPIKSIAVLGAGAMGAMYASFFQRAEGFEVRTVATGERAERLRRETLFVNGQPLELEVFDPSNGAEVGRPADLVIVAVKQHHLAEALEDLRPLVGPDTVFLSVLNGLDSEPVIAEAFSPEQVLFCIALGMDGNRNGSKVHFGNAGRLTFGEAHNEPASAAVIRVQVALDQAGLVWETPVDMRRSMWWKFMANVGVNQASALCRAPYAVMHTSEHARTLMLSLIDEVVTLSQLEGVNLGGADVERWLAVLDGLNPAGKTSMLQDVEARRLTEVDIFAGKVVSLGEAHGVGTPFNRMAFHAISALPRD
jgi:2-dehydropantoate 2-reductase